MKTQGDSKRPRSVKRKRSAKTSRKALLQPSQRPQCVRAEFDQAFNATAQGGAVLAEKVLRSLGLRRDLAKYLPARSDAAQYSTEDAAHAIVAALLVGGKGIGACELLSEDSLLCDIFGLHAPSPSTTYRVLCDLAGLDERDADAWYEPAGSALPRLDMLGQPVKQTRLRRIVPDEAEAASDDHLAAFDLFTAKMAVRCAKAMPHKLMRLYDRPVLFGDATDLEVEGRCFDAARKDRHGKQVLRWQTVSLGPLVIGQDLHEGNIDEGVSMPRLMEQAATTVHEVVGRERGIALLDGAYFEQRVIEAVTEVLRWDFIVCANQQRNLLTRIAEERNDWEWHDTGADAGRGWRASQVCCFMHLPGDWKEPVTIVARRWLAQDEIDGAWHYAFVATRIEPEALPDRLRAEHGYASAIWMLYSTKQGHENYYKTPLRDFGLHHPPSCRLGVNQAFYTLATAASNIAMVMRYRVVPKTESGIAFWRFRQRYFQIAGRVVTTARRVTVWLAGGNVDAERQVLWRTAFAAAGRL